MNIHGFVLSLAGICVGALLRLSVVHSANANTSSLPSLWGEVSSRQEGAMEGVVVTARRKDAAFTVSVISDGEGYYHFPAGRLAPGHYSLEIRAIGYELKGPGSAEIARGGATRTDLVLEPTADLAAQMSNSEWLMSIPGTRLQKDFLRFCGECHMLQRVVSSRYDEDQFPQAISRMMSYTNNSFPLYPQLKRVPGTYKGLEAPLLAGLFHYDDKTTAAWLASINLSGARTWRYPLRTLPRLKGKSTRVIITEYDLPNKLIEPHDVVMDKSGIVWFSEFDRQFLGRFDPRTLRFKQYPIPVHRPGFPTGALDLEFDQQGALWIANMYQGDAAVFDSKTGTLRMIDLPGGQLKGNTLIGHLGSQHWEVDRKVWLQDAGLWVHRVDRRTNKWELFRPYGRTSAHFVLYGLYADDHNNAWLLNWGDSSIGRIDAATGKIEFWRTPTAHSNPRRGRFDAQARLWFAEFGADKIGMLNTRTLQFKEWTIPGHWVQPYDVAPAGDEVWAAGMSDDRVTRLNWKTGEITQYQLPSHTNVRRIFVQRSHGKTVIWMGDCHGASIIKLEPLS